MNQTHAKLMLSAPGRIFSKKNVMPCTQGGNFRTRADASTRQGTFSRRIHAVCALLDCAGSGLFIVRRSDHSGNQAVMCVKPVYGGIAFVHGNLILNAKRSFDQSIFIPIVMVLCVHILRKVPCSFCVQP